MNVTRKLVTSLLLLALLLAEACTKKKPPVPPHAQAPTIAEALPDEIPEKPEVPPTEISQAPVVTPPPKKPPNKKTGKITTKKANPPASTTVAATPPPAPAPAQTPPPQNTTQTVANLRPPHNNPEPAPEMTVAAAIPNANKQREDTAHLVDTTENALKNITRPLNDEEKNMRTQIETYLQQSRKATAEGDYDRAFNLAKKAQVLVEALIKP
jgi:ElaB/YqjD/DUF883 family membrane-anchored ribosome-binding protein